MKIDIVIFYYNTSNSITLEKKNFSFHQKEEIFSLKRLFLTFQQQNSTKIFIRQRFESINYHRNSIRMKSLHSY